MTAYAWTITVDYLDEPDDDMSCVGVTGPSDAPDELVAQLKAGKGHTFTLYDDDGERYVKGRIVGDMNDEEVCYAPLADYGMGALGAVAVRYAGHPEWDCS